MGIVKAIRNVYRTAADLLTAGLCMVLLAGPVQFCLCDPDPDGCGAHCHDCSQPQTEECVHVSVDLGDFTVPDKNTVPAAAPADAVPDFRVLPGPVAFDAQRPSAASPPPLRDRYAFYSPTLNPLS